MPTLEVPDGGFFGFRAYLREANIAAFDISTIAAFWYSGNIYSEHMPALAGKLLERGFDGKHLRLLAGNSSKRVTHADIDEDVNRAFRELGVSAPLPKSAAELNAARHVAQEVVDSRVDAADGICMIAELFDWDVRSQASSIVSISYELENIRRGSPEVEQTKAEAIAACREFLMVTDKPIQKQ